MAQALSKLHVGVDGEHRLSRVSFRLTDILLSDQLSGYYLCTIIIMLMLVFSLLFIVEGQLCIYVLRSCFLIISYK